MFSLATLGSDNGNPLPVYVVNPPFLLIETLCLSIFSALTSDEGNNWLFILQTLSYSW